MLTEDKRHMSAALELAERGRGSVEPNPMVGAVIVRDGVVIARGWHASFGGPHAEIEALDAARDAGVDLRDATMYVTLEPCCHRGRGKKTPPCTEAIIPAGIARVVVAMEDPDANVSGRGIAALRSAGIEVTVGVCERRARRLLAGYVKLRTQHRPWVICKWAQTADGYLSLPPGRRRWISSPESRRYAHTIRRQCDGILVGIETVLADDPLLTNRSGAGAQPVRVVLDSRLRIPPDCRLVRTAADAPVIVVTTACVSAASAHRARRLTDAGVELLEVPSSEGGADLPALLDELGRRNWTYLLVEGGAKVLDSFIGGHLADELLVFVAPDRIGQDAGDLARFDIAEVQRRLSLAQGRRTACGRDLVLRYLLSE